MTVPDEGQYWYRRDQNQNVFRALPGRDTQFSNKIKRNNKRTDAGEASGNADSILQ